MRHFRMSPIHLPPIKKVKVKRRHYRVLLICAAGTIWAVHEFHPDWEMHAAFATNLLFALDPTSPPEST